jgi:hypothetical protein
MPGYSPPMQEDTLGESQGTKKTTNDANSRSAIPLTRRTAYLASATIQKNLKEKRKYSLFVGHGKHHQPRVDDRENIKERRRIYENSGCRQTSYDQETKRICSQIQKSEKKKYTQPLLEERTLHEIERMWNMDITGPKTYAC